MNKVIKQVRLALAMFVLAVVVAIAYSAFPATPVHAQGGGMYAFKSSGPVQLNPNDSALIGLLFPAPQRTDKPCRLRLFDSMGKPIVDIPVVGMGDGSVRTAFFDVTFMDGNLRVMDHVNGKLLATQSHSDGMLIGLLVPAVQTSGRSVGAISASIQLFDAMKQRGQVIQMCDGSI